MAVFNQDKREKNILRSSVVGTGCNILNMVMAFIYRTVFIYILSASYLGVNGLFTNILTLLSLAELGITTAITYRVYEPISRGDVQQVGKLLYFYKWIYRIIAIIVFAIGMSLFPFLSFFIKEANEIPADVNLQVVYLLYLFQSVSSYFFVYKLTILTADQREYLRIIINTIAKFANYVFQIITLLIWRNFSLSLLVAIVTNVTINFVSSLWVTQRYRAVFQTRQLPDRELRINIYKDMIGGGCHRIGSVILTSTDNLVLSKFAGLVATGLYSNYSLIIYSLKVIVQQLIGNATASFGNARVQLNDEENYILYKRMLFINLTVSSFCTVCLFFLIDDFIRFWLGADMLLGQLTVIVLCIQFYLDTGRIVTDSYIHGCGLFVKDRIRPFIEAALNIVISVLMVLSLGVAGVFIGTIVSFMLTAFWRAPHILCKYGFHRSSIEFWGLYGRHALFTVGMCSLVLVCKSALSFTVSNLGIWLMEAILVALLYVLIFWIVFARTEEITYMKIFITRIISRIKSHKAN